jgi:hypothetical protein
MARTVFPGWASPTLLLVGLPVVCLMAGCHTAKPPELPDVRGKVVFKGGKGRMDLLAGGKVRVRPESRAPLEITGTIDEDGTFVLSTIEEGKAVRGVPEGQYKIRIDPPLDDDRKPMRGVINPKYQDYDKSGLRVTVPVPGDLTLEVTP